MTIMTQLFASQFCSPSPPAPFWRWRGVSETLSRTRFNSQKPVETNVWLPRKASSWRRQSSDAAAGARYRARPNLTAAFKSP
jgi:hypothetical protein